MNEQWRDIPNTLYSVSDQGRVASQHRGGRVLKPAPDRGGYPYVVLSDGHGGKRTVKVHQLVAAAFLGPRPTPKHQTNHIDGIKTNNHASNLEWCTPSENQRHRRDVLKHGNNPRGEAHGGAKVTEVEVREILKRCAAGEAQTRVAAAFGICQANVSLIVHGRSWGWLT